MCIRDRFGTVLVRLVERNLHGFRKDRPITDARRRHADPVRAAFPASRTGRPYYERRSENKPRPVSYTHLDVYKRQKRMLGCCKTW